MCQRLVHGPTRDLMSKTCRDTHPTRLVSLNLYTYSRTSARDVYMQYVFSKKKPDVTEQLLQRWLMLMACS